MNVGSFMNYSFIFCFQKNDLFANDFSLYFCLLIFFQAVSKSKSSFRSIFFKFGYFQLINQI